jgi:hypothetical protein
MKLNLFTGFAAIIFKVVKFIGFYFTILCSMQIISYVLQLITHKKILENDILRNPFRGRTENHQHYLTPNESATVRAYHNFFKSNNIHLQ